MRPARPEAETSHSLRPPASISPSDGDAIIATDPNAVSADQTRLDSLTGLRFAAALLVFGVHLMGNFFEFNSSNPFGSMMHFFIQGPTGVSFFFILSGFVLTWSHQNGDTARAFYQRRFARIVPLHIFTWAVMLLILALLFEASATGPATASFFLLAPWVPSAAYYTAVNAPSWSLGCEAFFYLLFPLLLVICARWSSARRQLAMGSIVLGIVIWAMMWSPATPGLHYWAIYYFPPARLAEFLLGMLLAFEVGERRLPRIGLLPASLLALGAYVVDGWVPTAFAVVAVTVVPFALLIVAAAQSDVARSPSVWRTRPMVRLGVWSFAFYLVHLPIILLMVKLEPGRIGTLGAVVTGLVTLVACVAAAAAAYRWIERPLEQRLRGRARPVLFDPAVAGRT